MTDLEQLEAIIVDHHKNAGLTSNYLFHGSYTYEDCDANLCKEIKKQIDSKTILKSGWSMIKLHKEATKYKSKLKW